MATRLSIDKPSRFTQDKKLVRGKFLDIAAASGDTNLRSINDILVDEEGDVDAVLISSFIFGSEEGLESTQQLKVDFSEFRNHTFFNSAVVNTNVAFDKVLNGYPFDGTRADIVNYLEKLTGFERYIFNNFPNNFELRN